MPALAKKCEPIEESLGSSRDNINVGLELSGIVDEFGQTIVADVKSEVFRRNVFEIVRFFEDDGRVVRQYCRDIGLADRKVGKKEMVIHDNDVAFHCFLPHDGYSTS